MLVVFETLPDRKIAYLDLDCIMAIIDDMIITKGSAWALQVSQNDSERILSAWKLYKGMR